MLSDIGVTNENIACLRIQETLQRKKKIMRYVNKDFKTQRKTG